MPATLLIIVDGDPLKSGRVAEAVRIAAGVGAWKKVQASVFLKGNSALALADSEADLVDGDIFPRALPAILENGGSIYVEMGNAHLDNVGPFPYPFQLISNAEFSALCPRFQYVIRFSDSNLAANPGIAEVDGKLDYDHFLETIFSSRRVDL